MTLFELLFGKPVSSMSALELHDQLKKSKRAFVIDVRQPGEYRSGHINGARLIPLNELNSEINKLPQDREIVCVCASGNRSRSATRMLVQAGLNAVNLKGGMNSWRQANLPVKKGDAA